MREEKEDKKEKKDEENYDDSDDDDDERTLFEYKDLAGNVQGPFPLTHLEAWNRDGYLSRELEVRRLRTITNNNININNNNNNNNTLFRRRTTKSNKKQRYQNQGRSSKFFVTEAGRRGKAKEDLSSSLKVGEKIKIPIVGVEVPKPKLPAKVEAMVSGNERTIGIVLASLAIVKVRFGGRNRRGSMGRLEERGMLDENREVDEEKFFKGMMKTVRTVDMPELTEQQIMAARERRRASRAGDANLAKELETVEIPANHPFASNEKLDATQEAERKKKIIDANSPRRRTRPAAPKQK